MINTTTFSDLLIGRPTDPYATFTSLLMGKNRLKDTDKDGVPDVFDCAIYDPYGHGLGDPPTTPTQTPTKELYVEVSRGGGKIRITPQEEREAWKMLQSYARKRKLPSYYGRSEAVRRRAGYLIGEYQRRGYAVQESYARQQHYLRGEGYKLEREVKEEKAEPKPPEPKAKPELPEILRPKTEREMLESVGIKVRRGEGYSRISPVTGRPEGSAIPETLQPKTISAYEPWTEQVKRYETPWLWRLRKEPIETLKKTAGEVLLWGSKVVSYVPSSVLESLTKYQTEKYKRGRWITEPSPTGLKGTVTVKKVLPYEEKELPFVDISEIQRERQSELSFKAEQIYKKVEEELMKKYKKKIENLQKEMQEWVNKGEDANKVLQEFNTKVGKYQQEFEKEFKEKVEPKIKTLEKEEEQYLSKLAKEQELRKAVALSPVYVGTGLAIGFVAGVSPIVGYGIMGYGAVSTIAHLPEITAPILKGERLVLATMGIQAGSFLIGGVLGGVAGAKIRGKLIEAPKIKKAISESKVKINYRQLTTREQISSLQISPEGKAYLRNLVDKGFSVRLAEGKLIPPSSKAAKYLPDVKSQFVEVLTRDGKIVERISLGKFIGEYKGKVFSRNIVSDAIGKIEGSTGKYFTRSFISKPGKKFKPIEYYEFLEDTQLTRLLKKGKHEFIAGESKIQLLKHVEKPKPTDITKIYRLGKPTEQGVSEILRGLKGKPYGKSEFIYTGKKFIEEPKLLYGKGEVSTRWQNLIIGKYTARYGKGISIFKRVFEPAKKIKLSKPWELEKIESMEPSTPSLIPKGKVGQGLIYVREFPYKAPSSIYEILTYKQAYAGIPKYVSPITFKTISPPLMISTGLTKAGGRLRITPLQLNIQGAFSQLKIQEPKQVSKRLETVSITKTIQREGIGVFQAPAEREKLIQPQISKVSLRVSEGISPIPTITTPIFIEEMIILPFLSGRKKYQKATRVGYFPYVKEKGKFVRVSEKPMTKEAAISRGARVADVTTAATFKIEPLKQTKVVKGKKKTVLKRFKESELEKDTSYFSQVADKFRRFMIRRGNKILMQNKWIEKRGKPRIDTPGEKYGLTVAAYMARQRKIRAGLPTRKTKKPKSQTSQYFGF